MEKGTEIDNKLIGQRIREGREIFELSREEFAEMLSLSDYYIGQLERGQRQMSLGVLVKIANCLHLSLDYLIFGKPMYQPGLIADAYENSYVRDDVYDTRDLNKLLNKCSPKELDLIKRLIKTILPYMR
ncbi:MAG TPA: helix-turn-helix transcriptional regulator [Syntrophomonas sp.]|nr:helix-turn-helix transcriptional regulator [Syntrophomonas sp.]